MKRQVDNMISQLKFDNNKEYKIEVIYNSWVYAKILDCGYLLGIYFLVIWKSYFEEKNV